MKLSETNMAMTQQNIKPKSITLTNKNVPIQPNTLSISLPILSDTIKTAQFLTNISNKILGSIPECDDDSPQLLSGSSSESNNVDKHSSQISDDDINNDNFNFPDFYIEESLPSSLNSDQNDIDCNSNNNNSNEYACDSPSMQFQCEQIMRLLQVYRNKLLNHTNFFY